MSDRLISADKAKEVLKHLLYETAMNNELDIADIYEDIIENRLDTWIELIPTADAAPVRHGQWLKNGDRYCECSVCHHEGNISGADNYCWYCGVDMREVEDSKMVRCKDSIYWNGEYCGDFLTTDESGFCAWGVRKEDA